MLREIVPERLGHGASKGALFGSFRSGGGCDFCSGLHACRSCHRGGCADGGFSDEYCTCFDGEGFGFNISNHFGARFEFDSISGGKIAVNLTINDNRSGLDFRLDPGIFAHSEVSIRSDFPFNFAIDDEVIGEFDGAFDFDIGG